MAIAYDPHLNSVKWLLGNISISPLFYGIESYSSGAARKGLCSKEVLERAIGFGVRKK